jgi:hypothetical protein
MLLYRVVLHYVPDYRPWPCPCHRPSSIPSSQAQLAHAAITAVAASPSPAKVTATVVVAAAAAANAGDAGKAIGDVVKKLLSPPPAKPGRGTTGKGRRALALGWLDWLPGGPPGRP